jgi:2Fe-2S ferredoxin
MSRGKNPFLTESDVRLPEKPYTITLLPEKLVIPIDPADLPDEGIGLRGSIAAALLRAGVDIDHACGGVLACSTCHVYVKEGLRSCGEATEEEEDMLDQAPALLPNSRLSCHTVPDGTADIVVQIPEWNRNAVKEGH